MNLQQTVESLSAQFGTGHDADTAKAEKFFNQLGKFAFGGFGAVVVIGIGILLVSIFNKFIGNGSNIMIGVFLMLFLVFAALSLVYVVYNESKKDNKALRTVDVPTKALESDSRETGRLLNEPTDLPIPSVIEDTTDLLHIDAHTRKL
jgi:hypothetical protein